MYTAPPERIEKFYAPLVGTEARVTELKEELTGYVHAPDDFQATDPYDRLQTGILDVVDRVAQDIALPDVVIRNARSAMKQTVAVTRQVGDTYAKQAKTPQDIARVKQSTDRSLSHLCSIAYMNTQSGRINLSAYFRGRNPMSLFLPLESRKTFQARYFWGERVTMSARSLKAEADEAGQLDISPRFDIKMPYGPPPRKCPATMARIEEHGKQRSALRTLVGAIGDVAVTEIFPHYFHIAAAGGE